jgi:two-component system NtrC family sensor kinase
MENPLTEHMPRDDHGEEKLLRQLADNEKMAELGRLSAGIIHEINTPLSVIAAASQMILCEKDLSELVTEMVERIHQEVQRLSQLTRGILSFSREDSPDGEADVNRILHEVVTFLKYEIQKRSILVNEDFAPRLPLIDGNPNLLKQIFLNLVVNALQAMGNGGRLFLDTSLTDNDMILVRIRDTGAGIPRNVLARIFDPFFTTKEQGEGTGLGLFITRKNVEHLGGRIEVESREKEGTCFTLMFPPAAP